MDDVRAYLIAVLVNVIHVKLRRQQGIPLDGNHSVFLAVHVLCINVHLRPVKSRFPNIFRERNAKFRQNVADMSFRFFPYFRFPDIFLRVFRVPLRQVVCHFILQPKCGQAILCQSKAALKFLHHLVGTDNQMSLGNGELAHPGQPVHFAGVLIAEQGRSLPIAQRKVAVRMLCRLIDIILERTGHGTQGEHFLIRFFISKDKHPVGIMVPMAGNLIQIAFCHERGLRPDIAPLVVFQILNPSLHSLHHLSALRH